MGLGRAARRCRPDSGAIAGGDVHTTTHCSGEVGEVSANADTLVFLSRLTPPELWSSPIWAQWRHDGTAQVSPQRHQRSEETQIVNFINALPTAD
jgi:hypothetical protein